MEQTGDTEIRTCINCGEIYQEELVHVIYECPTTSELRSQFLDAISDILLPEFLPEQKLSLLLQYTVPGHLCIYIFLFFQNAKVYRFINYPVIFPNVLAA